jgi:hypothetical protein
MSTDLSYHENSARVNIRDAKIRGQGLIRHRRAGDLP